MPGKLEIWTCKFCGAEAESKSAAKTCEDNHLHAKDLKVTNLETHFRGEFYTPGESMPARIRVAGVIADKSAVYIRADLMPRVTPPTQVNAPRNETD